MKQWISEPDVQEAITGPYIELILILLH